MQAVCTSISTGCHTLHLSNKPPQLKAVSVSIYTLSPFILCSHYTILAYERFHRNSLVSDSGENLFSQTAKSSTAKDKTFLD